MLKRPALATNPSGELVARSRGTMGVEVWRVGSDVAQPTATLDKTGVVGLSWLSDTRLAVATQDGNVSTWSQKPNGQFREVETQELDIRSTITSLISDDTHVAIGDDLGRIWLLRDEPTNGTWTIGRVDGHSQAVDTMAFSPDGKKLVTASRDHTIAVWDATLPARDSLAPTHSEVLEFFSVAFDSVRAVTVVARQPEPEEIRPERISSEDVLDFFSIAHDAQIRSDKSIALPDVAAEESGLQEITPVVAHPEKHDSVVMPQRLDERDEPPMVAFSELSRVELEGTALSLAFSPDGTKLVAGGMDHSVHLWSLSDSDMNLVASEVAHAGWVSSVAFSPDQQRIASASWDNSIGVFDSRSLRPVASFNFHRDYVVDLKFASNTTLYSASYDGMAAEWNFDEHRLIRLLDAHQDWVESVHPLPDGRVLTFSSDGMTCLWDVDEDAPSWIGAPADVVTLGESANFDAYLHSEPSASLASASSSATDTAERVRARKPTPVVSAAELISKEKTSDSTAELAIPYAGGMSSVAENEANADSAVETAEGARLEVSNASVVEDDEPLLEVSNASVVEDDDSDSEASIAASEPSHAESLGLRSEHGEESQAAEEPSDTEESEALDLQSEHDQESQAQEEPSDTEESEALDLQSEHDQKSQAQEEPSDTEESEALDLQSEHDQESQAAEEPSDTEESEALDLQSDQEAQTKAEPEQPQPNKQREVSLPGPPTAQNGLAASDADDQRVATSKTLGERSAVKLVPPSSVSSVSEASFAGAERTLPEIGAFDSEIASGTVRALNTFGVGIPTSKVPTLDDLDTPFPGSKSDPIPSSVISDESLSHEDSLIGGNTQAWQLDSESAEPVPDAPIELSSASTADRAAKRTPTGWSHANEFTKEYSDVVKSPFDEADRLTFEFTESDAGESSAAIVLHDEASSFGTDGPEPDASDQRPTFGTGRFNAPGIDELSIPVEIDVKEDTFPGLRSSGVFESPFRELGRVSSASSADEDSKDSTQFSFPVNQINEIGNEHTSERSVATAQQSEASFAESRPQANPASEERTRRVDDLSLQSAAQFSRDEVTVISEVTEVTLDEIWTSRTTVDSPKMGIVRRSKPEATEFEIKQTIPTSHRSVFGLALSPDGKSIASCGEDNTLCIWGIDGKLRHCLHIKSGGLNSVVFSHDSRMICAAGDDGQIHVWLSPDGVQAGGFKYSVLPGHQVWITNLDVSADTRTLVSTGYDGTARVWDLSSGTCLRKLSGHTGPVTDVALGKRTYTCGSDGTVKVWNDSWKQVDQYHGFDKLTGICTHGSLLCVTAVNGDVYAIRSGNLIPLQQHRGEARATFCRADGVFATIGEDGLVMFYQPDSDSPYAIVNVRSPLWSMAFNRHHLICGDDNGQIHIFKKR